MEPGLVTGTAHRVGRAGRSLGNKTIHRGSDCSALKQSNICRATEQARRDDLDEGLTPVEARVLLQDPAQVASIRRRGDRARSLSPGSPTQKRCALTHGHLPCLLRGPRGHHVRLGETLQARLLKIGPAGHLPTDEAGRLRAEPADDPANAASVNATTLRPRSARADQSATIPDRHLLRAGASWSQAIAYGALAASLAGILYCFMVKTCFARKRPLVSSAMTLESSPSPLRRPPANVHQSLADERALAVRGVGDL